MNQNHCWKEIGINGDHSCPELKTVIHCRNCSVYSQLGSLLFERPAPEGYLEEYLARIASRNAQKSRQEAVLIAVFRLGDEFLGLPAKNLEVVLHPSSIHHIPHRSDHLFRGLVNVKGKLLLCAALEELLSIPKNSTKERDRPKKLLARLVVLQNMGETWAFEVDEFYGIEHFYDMHNSNLPTLSSETLEHYTQSILEWDHNKVSFLDIDHIFESLTQHIL